MTVDELFTNLSLHELSNLSMGDSGEGEISERHKPKVIFQTNNGLLDLYTRFILKEKGLLIEQREGKTTYPLSSQFAESNWDGHSDPRPFINDIGEPFTDDLLKVIGVTDGFGRDLPLNDRGNPDSLFTPTTKVLQVPRAVPGVVLSLTYQAKHPPLTLDEMETELELPEVLFSALTAFIAWKIYSGMNTQEAMAIAQGHHDTYENECASVTQDDTVNTSISTTSIVFRQRGWR
jgi:hypothetical protein